MSILYFITTDMPSRHALKVISEKQFVIVYPTIWIGLSKDLTGPIFQLHLTVKSLTIR